ncbi:MAG TPA: hypothetical protein DD856_10725 [Sulfobacillus sp.]|nr:hypothetical protein [Sulfobacillus sp.]
MFPCQKVYRTIRIRVSEELRVLEEERFHDPHPPVQLNIEAVYLTAMELPRPEVARLSFPKLDELRRLYERLTSRPHAANFW